MASWEETASKKRASLFAKIPEPWRLPESFCAAPTDPGSPNLNVTTDVFLDTLPVAAQLSATEKAITRETRIPRIHEQYESWSLTAEEMATAFCHRAAINHQMTNCLAEIRFEEAIAEAKAQDEYLRTHNKLIGPLHGIPVSLKDQMRVEGLETAMAYVGWLGKVETAETESAVVKQIKRLGGIIIAKTQVPQALMLGEVVSNLYGRGLNPYNRLLSPGGSSGGEGSLLAAHGSIIGVGTDFGGSIRTPSAFSNLFGLKPSHGRFSYRGLANPIDVPSLVQPVLGPMSTEFDNLIHYTKAILETEVVDPEVVKIPWRTSHFDQVQTLGASGGLCFAVLPKVGDGILKPHPPIARGMQLAVDAVQKAGHKVIEWKPPSHKDGYQLWVEGALATGFNIHDALNLSGEPLLEELVPIFGKELPTKSLSEYFELLSRFKKYQEDYAEYWESTRALTGTGRPVDGLILPVASHAAVRHSMFFRMSYTTVINVLDYAAVTVPVAFADKNIDTPYANDEPLDKIDEMNWKAYDPEIYHGAPIGIQIVTQRLEEEKALALGQVLSRALS